MKKTSFLTLVLILINLTIPKNGQNCGGNYMYYNMLFDRDLVFSNGKTLSSFNLWNYNSSLYGTYSIQLQNATEWANFLENKYIAKDLIQIIYRQEGFTSYATEMSNLKQARILDKDIDQKEIVFINYLQLSLQIENHLKAYTPDPWSYEEKEKTKNPEEYNRLIAKANQMLEVAQHPIIKERLAFQIIKLHRYEEKYQDVLNAFERNFAATNSFIGYWAMDHYAGALAGMGRKAEANYYFSKVYVNSPSRRESAYLSISINSDQEMNEAKTLCQSNDEKLALHFIRGMETKNLAIDDIDFIFKNGGNHEYARVLMSYEINNLEKILLNHYGNAMEDSAAQIEETRNYVRRLIELNKQILVIDDSSKFWHLSLAYLHFLNQDYVNCQAILKNNMPTDKNLKMQYTAIEILNLVASKTELSIADENIIGHKLYELNNYKENLSSIEVKNDNSNEPSYNSNNYYRKNYEDYNTINEYLFQLIYTKVKGKNAFKELIYNGQTIESDLYNRDFPNWNEMEQGKKKLTPEYLDELILTFENTEKTKLVEFAAKYYFDFVNSYHYHYYQHDLASIKYILQEAKATLLMRNPNTLKDAIALFEKLPSSFINEFTQYIDPFQMSAKNIKLNPREEIDYENASTKLSLAKRLQMHLEKAKATNSSIDYFNLGIAYYNLSYYSNCWRFLAFDRSTLEPNGFCDNLIALSFLNKALSLGLKNKELEAKAHFMAARCELNLFTQNYGEIQDNYEDNLNFDKFLFDIKQQGFQKNFAVLKNTYFNTQFYQEIVSECSYFSYYLN
jgi:hypothetical protein